MNLEITLKLSAVVPDGTLGNVSKEQLAALAQQVVEARALERLQIAFRGWPLRSSLVVAVDGQPIVEKGAI